MLLALALAADGVVPLSGWSLAPTRAEPDCERPGSDPDAIIVCGRRDPDARYRTVDPKAPFDPAGNRRSVMRERARWAEGGETGPGSCSAVGPGGWTGCVHREWDRQRQQWAWRRPKN